MLARDRDLVAEDLRQYLSLEPKPERMVSVSSIFAQVKSLDRESVEFILGSRFGGKLKDFVDSVDLTHPEVADLFEGCLVDGSDFALDLQELVRLGLYAKENKLTRIMPAVVKKVVNQERERRSCLRSLGSPMDNRVHARLMQSHQERNVVRHTKKAQVIELGIITKKGDELWHSLSPSFRPFVAGKAMYNEEIAEATRKANRLRNLGCLGLAGEIDRSIDVFQCHVKDCYYGFNRITVTTAAVILARLHDYTISTTFTHWESNERKCCIKVPRPRFFDFTTEERPPLSRSDYFLYQPMAYPAHRLNNLASAETKQLIELLDNFPDANGKAIFDHFIAVVPGVQYPTVGHEGCWRVRNYKGVVEVYETSEIASEAVDFSLVENGYITPVLLGERDGKCYFIDYFRGK
jgi:hypothetical protein